jgi:hypothetical protein
LISMGAFPFLRSRLYRKSASERQSRAFKAKRNLARSVTIAALALAMLSAAFGQVAKRRPADKGPRALCLIELAANGKAHLVPVTIMIDGRFYDAAAYKADPVPMALQRDIVYEAVKTGVSQGLFTVAGALQVKGGWVGAGKWQSTADIEAEKAKAKAEAEKRDQKALPPEQEIGGPPKLKRAPETQAQNAPSQAPAPSTPAPSQPSSTTPNSPSSRSANPSPEQRPPSPASIDDPNRPTLRHQAASETAHEQTKAGNENEPLKGALEFIPAISDADGPQPRPYAYQLKPDEEQVLLKKILAMAAEEVRARASHLSQGSGDAKPAAATKKSKVAPVPEFHDTQLRVFDLSNTNESVLVLTTQAKISSAPDLDFIVALVARQDIYGDLHKVFVRTTDDKHLDVLPRYDLIDAVDADGDGVGELLFRETWEWGTAFVVYRVIGDQLWPLFEGKPGT